ncbi:hypothetical protein PInf_013788 [Phytophthora infestans]|nr:hypothetical protein PInf_013788 [Phytophthora infestans]
MPHHAEVDLILGTDFMIPAGIRLDLYNSSVKLPDELVILLIRSSNAPTKTEFGPNVPWVTRGDPAINSAFKLEDVRADRTPALHDGQDVSDHLSKFEDDGAISDASTNSAVEGTSAVRTKEEASATEDSAIAEGDPEECSEQVLRDEQPVIDDRAKFDVIRPSIVGEVNSAMSTLTTISAGINQVVTANSALEDPAVRNDLGAVPACHRTADYASEECGRVDVCPAVTADSAVQRPSVTTANSKLEVLLSRDVEANSEGLSWTVKTSNHSDVGEARAEYGVDGLSSAAVVNSAMGTPKACIIQLTAVDSTSADLNAESDSDAATACRQDVSYTGEEFALMEVSSAVSVNSADQHYDATEYYDSRKVLLHEGIKPNDDPATADSDKFEHAEVRSDIVVDSADTGPHVDDNFDLSETDIFERRGTDLELTDYAHELAFLPDLIEAEPTELDYGAPNVKSSSHTPAQSASHGEQHPVWNDDGSDMSDVREGKIHQDLPRIHPYLDSLRWIWDILYKSGSSVDPMKEGWSVPSDGGSSSHG